jgi:hypothetical protein
VGQTNGMMRFRSNGTHKPALQCKVNRAPGGERSGMGKAFIIASAVCFWGIIVWNCYVPLVVCLWCAQVYATVEQLP